MTKVRVRSTDTEPKQAGDYYDGIRRYYDHNLEHTVVKIMTGDCYVATEKREMLVTILGSCISVCARDTLTGVGGMNHILLPGLGGANNDGSTRYGAFAMEELLNNIYKNGGNKENLEVKIFGGGNVLKNSTSNIGTKNIDFVKNFLADERIPIKSKHVGGDLPRRIHYFVDTGKVMMRQLKRRSDTELVTKDEEEYSRKLIVPERKVELF